MKGDRGTRQGQAFGDLLSLTAAIHRCSLQQRLNCWRPQLTNILGEACSHYSCLKLNLEWVIYSFWFSEYAKQGVVQRSLRRRSQVSVLVIMLLFNRAQKKKWKNREVGRSREDNIQPHPLPKSITVKVCVQHSNLIWTKLSVLQKGLNSDNFWSFPIFLSVKTLQARDFLSTLVIYSD